jgi:predicted nucleic acid-binding protein
LILLDTNVVSETMRRVPDPRVVAWLDAQAAETLYLSTVSLAELLLGIALLPDGRRKTELGLMFEARTSALFGDRVLPFDAPAARSYALIASRARTAGRPLSAADAQIAAVAAVHGYSVATRDFSPFAIAGVPIINPWANS